MNLNKPICIAENKKANMLIIAREYKRAAGILAGYLNKITDAVFQVQKLSVSVARSLGRMRTASR